MARLKRRRPFRSDGHGNSSLRASSGLVAAIWGALGVLDGVKELRVLHVAPHHLKFFVVLEHPTTVNVQAVVQVMVQIEDAFTSEGFDYDTIGVESLPLVPSAAQVVSLS